MQADAPRSLLAGKSLRYTRTMPGKPEHLRCPHQEIQEIAKRRRLGIGIWVNDGGYRLPLPGPGNDGSLKAQPV